MTCIVGIATNGDVHIGADSCASVDEDLFLIQNGKLFERGPFRFGCAGERRASEIVRFGFDPPEVGPAPGENELDCFMATVFADTLRALLKAKGALSVIAGLESFTGSMLVGVRSRLYFVSGNFSVTPVLDGEWACGSGRDFALGSLRSTRGQPTRKRIEIALEAASYYGDGIRPPFHIIPGNAS